MIVLTGILILIFRERTSSKMTINISLKRTTTMEVKQELYIYYNRITFNVLTINNATALENAFQGRNDPIFLTFVEIKSINNEHRNMYNWRRIQIEDFLEVFWRYEEKCRHLTMNIVTMWFISNFPEDSLERRELFIWN